MLLLIEERIRSVFNQDDATLQFVTRGKNKLMGGRQLAYKMKLNNHFQPEWRTHQFRGMIITNLNKKIKFSLSIAKQINHLRPTIFVEVHFSPNPVESYFLQVVSIITFPFQTGLLAFKDRSFKFSSAVKFDSCRRKSSGSRPGVALYFQIAIF